MHGTRKLVRRFAQGLAAGHTERIDKLPRGLELRCAEGQLWITQDGDCKDIVLRPLETYRPHLRGPLSVHALAPSVLEVQIETRAPLFGPGTQAALADALLRTMGRVSAGAQKLRSAALAWWAGHRRPLRPHRA